jgi:ubiquinone/menaquinone biosynthesis C-methylase UbiE
MSHQAAYPVDLHSMVDWVDTVAQPGQRVLDIGCGDGSMVAALRPRFDAFGADPTAIASSHVVAMPFEDLDVAPVDVIVASLSLHHLADVDAAAQAMARLSHADTRILVREFDRVRMDDAAALRWWFHQRQARDVVMPDLEAHPVSESFDEFVDRWRTMMQHHVRPWSEVAELLAQAGFARVDEQWGPHWFRWGLGDSLRAVEVDLIERGILQPVGVRWHGRRVK